ncbi:E3 SUMO-protein ligase PIAS4b isoform X2 [Anguilla rostrata]|uniref:E3 SUMO-protein ligase PIAS4b isoform X2 n=2 Tax=Anguilla rostrata TaxID=7938 RepID=UPI0030CFA2B8
MAAELVEAMNMVKSFRVSDLQTLLTSMGRSKSGLKQDLVGRALRLVQKEHTPELLLNIRQLYESRFPKAAAAAPPREAGWGASRRAEGPPQPAPNLQGTDYLNGLPKPAPSPAAAEIKLAPLPFYQTLETLLPPTELGAQSGEKLQDSQCSFELTPSQVERIRTCRELRPSLKSIQVVLRICYTDPSSVQEDQYPPNIAVKVNQFYCHVPGYYPSNKPGVEPRRPCRPINITPWLHLSTATNRITVTWGNFGKRYCVSLYLVRVFTAAELFTQLKHFSVESTERCRERIQDKLRFDPESEIATTGLCVSLICPLVKMRLGVPCRVLTCAHLQCFDAVFFLQMNEKKPTWTCPVCDKPAPFELLAIDGLLSEILKETEDVEEIEYLADGSWRPIREEKEKERSSTPECPLLDISAAEANGHSPAHSGSSQTGATAPPAAPAVVVDLTEDTFSEEEEGGGGAGDSEDTDDSQDSPPPKKGRCGYDKDLVTAY